jgi:hypothetical protein
MHKCDKLLMLILEVGCSATLAFAFYILLVPRSVSSVLAGDAHPFSYAGHVEILSCQGVPRDAVGSSCVMGRRTVTTEYVLSGRDGLKMLRVHASSHATEMVKLLPFGYSAHKQFVGDAVSAATSAFVRYSGVSATVEHGCGPEPASRNGVRANVSEQSLAKDSQFASLVVVHWRSIIP